MREHYYCVKEIFDLYNTKEKLEELSKRPDLDTVCAFDYHKMKSHAMQPNALGFADFQPEAVGTHIP